MADAMGESLGDVARLDTMVTVVDASSFPDQVDSIERLQDRGLEVSDTDTRSIAELLIDQVEFADRILLNKTDLVSEHEQAHVASTLRRLNPRADIIPTVHSEVALDKVVNTGLFDFDVASESPGWLQEMRGEHAPETEEYGVGSFVFRARWPFHPERLYNVFGKQWPGVLRSKGVFWLGSQPRTMLLWSQAGKFRNWQAAGHWWADVPRDHRPDDPFLQEEAQRVWDEQTGDRRQEVVFIGIDVHEKVLRRQLQGCLMTEEELVADEPTWQRDPFDTRARHAHG